VNCCRKRHVAQDMVLLIDLTRLGLDASPASSDLGVLELRPKDPTVPWRHFHELTNT
jgi:hypothetical protein